jgi:hypothetical protein
MSEPISSPASVYFREVQRFGQIWIWLLVGLVTGVAWYGAIIQLVYKKPFGDKPAPDSLMVVIWVVFGVGFPLLFYSIRLVTEVRPDGVYVRFVPLHRSFHKISSADIQSCEVVTYRPLRDYGGYGIRYGIQGKAYNVSGNRGVRLHLKDKKPLLIGSQSAEQLAAAVRAISAP